MLQPALMGGCVQSLLERAVVLGFGAGQQTASPALCDLIVQYASILAAQVLPPRSQALQQHSCTWAASRIYSCTLTAAQMSSCT